MKFYEIKEIVDKARAAGKTPDFRGADLSRADLNGADLAGVDLCKANLNQADLEQANLEGANLIRADLTGANLYRTHLKNANLTRAILTETNLIKPTLTGADLSEVDLSKACAILDGSDMQGAKLFGTNLRGTIGLISENGEKAANLKGAEYSPDTIWPAGFDYKSAIASDFGILGYAEKIIKRHFALNPHISGAVSFCNSDDKLIKMLHITDDPFLMGKPYMCNFPPLEGTPYPSHIYYVPSAEWLKIQMGQKPLPDDWRWEDRKIFSRDDFNI